jgi:hypothetical protein
MPPTLKVAPLRTTVASLPMIVSLPLPPVSVSLSAPPTRASSPAPPAITSSPAPPRARSDRLPPVNAFCPAVAVTSARMSSVSSAVSEVAPVEKSVTVTLSARSLALKLKSVWLIA